MSDSLPRWWREQPFWAAALVVGLVALASAFTGLWNGFTYDDVIVIQDNPAVHALRSPVAFFTESYWGPARGHVALYRPATVLGWSLQWAIADGKPWPFHLVNLLLYVASSVALVALLRRFVAPGAALVAAALFAAHPLHVEAVANVVGQAELWVALLLLVALALYARDRVAGPLRPATAATIALLYTTSLFFKEHGIVLPALLLAVEWAGQQGPFRLHTRAWYQARVLALVLGLLAALYLAWRSRILGEVTGDYPVWALNGLSAPQRWLVMLGLVPELLRLLVWPARLYADYSPAATPVLKTWALGHLPGLLILGGTLGLTLWAWRRRAALPIVAALWFCVAYLPVSNIVFPVGVLIAERTLFLPSVAVALLAAWLLERAALWQPSVRAVVTAASVALIGLGTVHSAIRSRVWADNPTLFSTLAVESPTNFRAMMALADFHSRGGRWSSADSLFRLALALDPGHVPGRLTYVQELQYQGRCDVALPMALSARRDDPTSSQAMASTVICLLAEQRFSEARSVALDGAAAGWGTPLIDRLRVVADSMLVVTDSVDARNRFAREGRAFVRGGGPLTVTVFRETMDQRRKADSVQAGRRSATPPAAAPPSVTP